MHPMTFQPGPAHAQRHVGVLHTAAEPACRLIIQLKGQVLGPSRGS